nr:MAG TPA: Putative ATP dependent Clp protease [Caudoviricetes sp.]
MSGMPQEDSRETKLIERKWRAGYSEKGKSGSEGGLCKPTVAIQQGDTCLPYVFAASQIYSMLKNHKGKVTVKIDGIAASAASVVAMAGDETLIAPTALMMIHDPSTCAIGNKADMEKAIELLEEVKESIINAYETKSHLSRNKIAKLMSDETWLNAKKAHEMGFVDGILFAEKKNPFPPEEEEEEESDEDEKKENSLTAMTYSKSKNLSAFLSKVSASAESVTGTPIDQLKKRLALLKY